MVMNKVIFNSLFLKTFLQKKQIVVKESLKVIVVKVIKWMVYLFCVYYSNSDRSEVILEYK